MKNEYINVLSFTAMFTLFSGAGSFQLFAASEATNPVTIGFLLCSSAMSFLGCYLLIKEEI